MSQFPLPPPSTNKTKFSSRLFSDLLLFCSFILSHPLYFSYFIFFSPYIVKVFSFLSPLFITTFLLLLALFTTLVSDNSHQFPDSFILTAYHCVLEKLKSNATNEDQESLHLEELEAAYKIVFEEPTLEVLLEQGSSSTSEEPIDKYTSHESSVCDQGQVTSNETLAEVIKSESLQLIVGGKKLDGLMLDDDDEKGEKEEKEVKAPRVESNKGEEEEEEEPSIKSGSKAKPSKVKETDTSNNHNGVTEYLSKVRSNSQTLGRHYENDEEYYGAKCTESYSLGSFGSMRREKEWKRTLACKLFEERHNVHVDGGAEGMDLLWETYETDNSNKVVGKSKSKKGKRTGSTVYNNKHYEEDEEDEEEEEEELDDDDGQLCCLQALKFSAGKMNLGVGRPNLVKFSKAIKGFGWLHHVTKHSSKKVHP